MTADLGTLRFVARAFCHAEPADAIVDWAVRRLEGGYDGAAMAALASLEKAEARIEDALPLLRRALAENGIAVDDRAHALRRYFDALMENIADGRLDPLHGAWLIWDEVITVAFYRAPFPGAWQWYDEVLREWDLLHSEAAVIDEEDLEPSLPQRIRDAALRAVGGQ